MKNFLRQKILDQRQRLSVAKQQQAAKIVAASLSKIEAFSRSKHVACYLSIKGELNTSPILEAIFQSDKTCYLPVLDRKFSRNLCFARYLQGEALVSSHYGIPEPVVENNIVILPKDLEVVFMPLVAFDESGNRLGQGGGYYDRIFAFKLNMKKSEPVSPILIGLAYEWQKVAVLDAASWDVPLDMVITESNCYEF